jgi:hypothetical protein
LAGDSDPKDYGAVLLYGLVILALAAVVSFLIAMTG